MTKVYFRNTATQKRYEIKRYSDDRKSIIIEGEHGEFPVPNNKDRIKQWGYELVQE